MDARSSSRFCGLLLRARVDLSVTYTAVFAQVPGVFFFLLGFWHIFYKSIERGTPSTMLEARAAVLEWCMSSGLAHGTRVCVQSNKGF